MVSVVVFHSALGRRAAIERFANVLRRDGHEVHAPDLYGGKIFHDIDSGVAERDAIGMEELVHRAAAAVEGLPADTVYAGFSMGARPAQLLASTRPGARGVLLIQGGAPLHRIGLNTWPEGLAVQMHVAADDLWFGRDAAAAVRAEIPPHLLDYREYRHDRHLFADEDLPEHDPHASAELLDSVRRWLLER